jgi:hypothetical protein
MSGSGGHFIDDQLMPIVNELVDGQPERQWRAAERRDLLPAA